MHDVASLEMRRRLVAHLRRRGYLHERRIMRAFLAVPREVFLPDELRRAGLSGVYRDDAIVTRRDPATRAPLSSSSQPAIMAVMLEMLELQPGQRVVEIGAGTGYNAALLALLAGRDGRLVTIDVDEVTARAAARALRALRASAHVVVADGATGWPVSIVPDAAVDRLEITASSDAVPREWFDHMAPGGRVVVPLRLSDSVDRAHAVTALVKVDDGFDSVAVTSGGFMPLRRPLRRPTPDAPEMLKIPGADEPATGPEVPMRRGPWMAVPRDDVSRLHITVRYSEPPDSRWVIERDDHWIGIDVLASL